MRHRRILKTGLGLVLVSLLVYFALDSAYFRIQTVTVEGNEKIPTQEIIALSGLETGFHFFSFTSGQVQQALKQNPWVRRSEVSRSIPGTVRISITEREPVAVTPYLNGFLVLDIENYVLDFVEVKDVAWPMITGWESRAAAVGDRLESVQIGAGIRCVGSMTPSIRQMLSEIWADERGETTLFLLPGLKVLMGQADAQLDQKFVMLESLLEDFTVNKMDVAYVDLRYDKPVVRLVDDVSTPGVTGGDGEA